MGVLAAITGVPTNTGVPMPGSTVALGIGLPPAGTLMHGGKWITDCGYPGALTAGVRLLRSSVASDRKSTMNVMMVATAATKTDTTHTNGMENGGSLDGMLGAVHGAGTGADGSGLLFTAGISSGWHGTWSGLLIQPLEAMATNTSVATPTPVNAILMKIQPVSMK